ncbi:magnesium citrate secondary transporter [Algoriphagus namhaensis]
MEIFKSPFFIIAAGLFWVNFILQRAFEIHIPIYHAYGDDLIAMPIILGICLQVLRWIHPARGQLIFGKKLLFFSWIYVSMVFEFGLPLFSSRYTQDWLDVVCYGFGVFLFQRTLNRPVLRSKKPLEL